MPVLPREVAERKLREQGWPAHAIAFALLQEYGPPDPVEAIRDAASDRLEKAEEHAVDKLYRAMGCTVYRLSQARASKQTPGLPDRWVVHTGTNRAWWHEVKRPVGGKQSPAQKAFQRQCALCGVSYVLGGVQAAELWLVKHGIARVEQDGTLVPRRPWIQIAEANERNHTNGV